MRALVILLLLLNVGFAAWQLTRHEIPANQRAPADAGVEPLRLLAENTPQPATIASEAVSPAPAPTPEVAVQTPPTVQPAPAVVAEPETTPVPTMPDTVHITCYAVGPFAELQQAELAGQRLQATGVSNRQRVVESRANANYRVVLPPLPSKESAVQVARQLAADGIADYQVILDDSQRNVISLGVFKDRQAATRRQAQIAAFGYAPRIEPHDVSIQNYWLDTQESGQTDEAAAVWAALLAKSPQAHRQVQDCH